jgi:hypothetical protein
MLVRQTAAPQVCTEARWSGAAVASYSALINTSAVADLRQRQQNKDVKCLLPDSQCPKKVILLVLVVPSLESIPDA